MTMKPLKLFIYKKVKVELNLVNSILLLGINLSKLLLKYLETGLITVKEKVIFQRNTTNAWYINNNGNVNNNNKNNSYFVVPVNN